MSQRAGRRGVRRGGFTLLEVLAATLIFALVVTVLIGTSSAGVRMAGVSRSRLEASLVAEQELARLETLLITRSALPEDYEETRDRYAIRVFSEPALDDFSSGGLALGGGDDGGDGGGSSGLAAILTSEAPGLDVFLRRFEIRVEWIEGGAPMTVRRSTHAFDWEGARAALPELFAAAAPGGSEGDGEGEVGDDDGPGDPIPQLPQMGDR